MGPQIVGLAALNGIQKSSKMRPIVGSKTIKIHKPTI